MIVIPHKFRKERRAVWYPKNRRVTFEFLNENNEWQADYTKWEYEACDDYFRDFYGELRCAHRQVWPDGICVECDVLATMFPGHSDAHEVIERK